MSEDEFRAVYERGYWAALDAFGIWKDGTQRIGCNEEPIRSVFNGKDESAYYLLNFDDAWENYKINVNLERIRNKNALEQDEQER